MHLKTIEKNPWRLKRTLCDSLWTTCKPVLACTTSWHYYTTIRPSCVERNPSSEWPMTLSRYISTFAWPGVQWKRPNNVIVYGKHNQTYQDVEIAFSDFAAAINDVKTQCDHFRWISADFHFGHPSPANRSQREFLNQHDTTAVLQQFCSETKEDLITTEGRYSKIPTCLGLPWIKFRITDKMQLART